MACYDGDELVFTYDDFFTSAIDVDTVNLPTSKRIDNSATYSMDGRLLDSNAKGIVIKGGKKMIRQ